MTAIRSAVLQARRKPILRNRRVIAPPPPGKMARIHIDQAIIKANVKDGGDRPAITVQRSTGPSKAHEVDIVDGYGRVVATIVSSGQLSCGARIWIETLYEPRERTRA